MEWIESLQPDKKVYIETFGCTANIADSMKIRAIVEKIGCKIVKNEKDADLFIINTCIVTERTELNVIKRLKYIRGLCSGDIIVAGCMPAAMPERVREVLGDNAIMIEPRLLRDVHDIAFDGVIGIVPISQGCVGNCRYCIVKRARGEIHSYDPERICGTVERMVRDGAKEIRITAQDCSAYGWDGLEERLHGLLRKLSSIKGNFRIRVGMMNPFTMIHDLDDIIDSFESEKIFKFFHIPVQSGSDKVLRDMNRKYKVCDFIHIVDFIRSRFEYCMISTDFIIGYPTETERDFESSVDLLRRIRAEKVNITRFSPRPGTEAACMNDLLEREKKRRSRMFSDLYHKIAYEQNKALEGRILEALVTEPGRKGGMIARDPAYRTVVLKDDIPLGSFCDVRVKEAKSTYLIGEVVASASEQ